MLTMIYISPKTTYACLYPYIYIFINYNTSTVISSMRSTVDAISISDRDKDISSPVKATTLVAGTASYDPTRIVRATADIHYFSVFMGLCHLQKETRAATQDWRLV